MKIIELFEALPGYQTRGALQHNPKGSYCLLQGKDLDALGEFQPESLLRLDAVGSPEKYLISPNDVLFQSRGSSHQAFLIDAAPPNVLAAAAFYILRPCNSGILPGYLAWYLNQSHAQSYFKTQAKKSTSISYVSKEALMDLEITVPDLETQAKIQAVQAGWKREKRLLNTYLEKKELLIQESCLQAIQSLTNKEKQQ